MRKYTLFFLVLAALGLCGAHAVSGMGSDAGKNTEAEAAHRPEPPSGALSPDAAQSPVQSPDVQSQYNNSTVYNSTTVYNTTEGYNGFAGTWRDPETGDIITSVIAPRPPQQPNWGAPLIVAPQVYPGYSNQPNPPGPPPRPYPGHGSGSVPPWQQPGWQNPRPPQGQMPPGWRPPADTRPWPHAPGWLPGPRNSLSPSGKVGPSLPGARR